MRNWISGITVIAVLMGMAGCGGVDPDVRRGNTFYANGKYYEASQAFARAQARKPEIFEDEELRIRFKDAYYYYGGQMELAGSLDAAVKYYEKGFELVPTEAGMCDKLADYFWEGEEFAKAAKYFAVLVDLDAQAPDTEKKWMILGEDYYALGYSLYKSKRFEEAVEALQQSLKASPKGRFARKAKSALESAKYELKKKK